MRQSRVRRGEFKERVIIKAVNSVDDGQGGKTEGAPVTISTMWAKVAPFSASRTLEYSQVTGSQGYEITMSYRADITMDESSLIVWNGKTLQVHSVRMINENRRQWSIIAFNKV